MVDINNFDIMVNNNNNNNNKEGDKDNFSYDFTLVVDVLLQDYVSIPEVFTNEIDVDEEVMVCNDDIFGYYYYG